MTPDDIYQLRVRLDLTQAELAARLGVAQETVSRWETGYQAPSPMAVGLLLRMERRAAKAARK